MATFVGKAFKKVKGPKVETPKKVEPKKEK